MQVIALCGVCISTSHPMSAGLPPSVSWMAVPRSVEFRSESLGPSCGGKSRSLQERHNLGFSFWVIHDRASGKVELGWMFAQASQVQVLSFRKYVVRLLASNAANHSALGWEVGMCSRDWTSCGVLRVCAVFEL